MDISFFLYRRLAKFITCKFLFQENKKIELYDKHTVASFKDVYCNPFYWKALSYVENKPRLVVDCGANYGYFTTLASSYFDLLGYSANEINWMLVEANPEIIPMLKSNLSDMNLIQNVSILEGLIGSGQNGAESEFFVNKKNYLASSSIVSGKSTKKYNVPNISLTDKLVEYLSIDVLKLDIEGDEYNVLKNEQVIFEKCNLLIVELHGTNEDNEKFDITLNDLGLQKRFSTQEQSGFTLAVYHR